MRLSNLVLVSVFLLVTNYSKGNTSNIEVIAIEYPPFTTLLDNNGGLAFKLLNSAVTDKTVKFVPLFLPPARAGKYLKENDWCGSFYPPPIELQAKKLQLSSENIRLGLVRKRQEQPFHWQELDELSGKTAVILRNSKSSEFSRQFLAAGIKLGYVETVQAGIQMVLLDRVDFSFADNVTFELLENKNKQKLQFSQSSLSETKVSIFISEKCFQQHRTKFQGMTVVGL
ncbi:MAG: transporter substrate-binding domain-containing protein [Gammaproteobacteria bacterium]|nr:transporter substrate-binding domain-containing protein [Gammaproteobacteria bacterium]